MEFTVNFKEENGGWTWTSGSARGWCQNLRDAFDSAQTYIDKYHIRKAKSFSGKMKNVGPNKFN